MVEDEEVSAAANELLSLLDERLVMTAAIVSAKGPLTAQERQAVREAADEYRKKHGLENADIARGIGYGKPTHWSSVIAGSYPEKHGEKLDEHLRTLNDWVEQDERRSQASGEDASATEHTQSSTLDADGAVSNIASNARPFGRDSRTCRLRSAPHLHRPSLVETSRDQR